MQIGKINENNNNHKKISLTVIALLKCVYDSCHFFFVAMQLRSTHKFISLMLNLEWKEMVSKKFQFYFMVFISGSWTKRRLNDYRIIAASVKECFKCKFAV